jgi:ATP-dependent helicase HrpA
VPDGSIAPIWHSMKRSPSVIARSEIIAAIAEHPVLIVAGETGSGKTTQLPKLCMAAGRGIDGWIGVTQPRRIAATSVSHRIAQELNEALGQTVGYKIRFQDAVSAATRIKMMTDGILLAEAHQDPFLNHMTPLSLMKPMSAASISILFWAFSKSCLTADGI